MTREEAKQILSDWNLCHYTPSKEAAEAVISAIDPLEIISALHSPTREMVERMRGEWISNNGEKVGTIDGSPVKSATCSNCGNWLVGSDEYSCAGYFCPSCGAPMTDEAVNMMLEKWRETLENA